MYYIENYNLLSLELIDLTFIYIYAAIGTRVFGAGARPNLNRETFEPYNNNSNTNESSNIVSISI